MDERLICEVRKDEEGREYFIHFKCRRRSYHPNDIKYKYCAVCHTFPVQQAKQDQLKKMIRTAEKRSR